MRRAAIEPRHLAIVALAVSGLLVTVTVAVALLESRVDVPDASSVYLLAVVAVAVAFGTTPAVIAAVASFLIYDFLFIEPHYTFTVRDPREWLNLLLLLVVGIVVGRLAGRERDRAEGALAREREARALFRISFELANARETAEALPSIVATVKTETRMSRVWVVLGEAVAADSEPGSRAATPTVHATLRRNPDAEPAAWVRVHAPARASRSSQTPAEAAFRAAITSGERTFGSLWASRPRGHGDPAMGETRVMAAAADQIGSSLERDRLLRDATSAEISRRSDALKSALLDSVSHDLRTPLASIRAAAGTLMDADVDWPPDERRRIATSIDREAEWLNRLVTNLLDMSRIEAGELKPSLGVFDVADLVDRAVQRIAAGQVTNPTTIDVPEDLAPVLADEVFIGQVLANTLDNAAKYAGPDAPISVSARQVGDSTIRITVEDGGAGVPPDLLPRLFEKFYRVPRKGEGSRRGTGIGLSVARGLVDAMGGSVGARSSSLGGLAVDIDLRVAPSEAPG